MRRFTWKSAGKTVTTVLPDEYDVEMAKTHVKENVSDEPDYPAHTIVESVTPKVEDGITGEEPFVVECA